MSVLFNPRRARALLGATAVLITLVLASAAVAVPARDQTTPGGQISAEIAAKQAAAKAQGAYYASYGHATTPIARTASATPADPDGPSWLGFALAAGGALLLGAVAGSASTIVVRRTRPAGFAG
jgi:hypothetical protein